MCFITVLMALIAKKHSNLTLRGPDLLKVCVCQNAQADLITASAENCILQISKITYPFYVFALTNMQLVAFFFYFFFFTEKCKIQWTYFALAVSIFFLPESHLGAEDCIGKLIQPMDNN